MYIVTEASSTSRNSRNNAPKKKVANINYRALPRFTR